MVTSFEYCLSCGGGFPFFRSSLFCKRCVFICLLYLSFAYLFWVCWVRGNFSGGPGHIFSVWDSAVWSAGPVQVYLGTILEWMAGLYRFFLSSGSVVVGTVLLKWWGVSFFSFSSVCCQLSWRAVVCGRILFFYIGLF